MRDNTGDSGNFLVELRGLSYTYPGSAEPALREVSLSLRRGDYLALCGANGSGKTTIGRCVIGLCKPEPGSIVVDGNLDPADPSSLFAIRQKIGMVFQSPQDQLVASIVEEEVAFGLENLGLPSAEMEARITEVLGQLGLSALRTRPCRFLSAGQQQRLAIASVLAMRPECIIFDEATAMIDPAGRASILDIMDSLNASGIAIIHITHNMDEAARARRVAVMSGGRLVFEGGSRELFALPNLAAWRLCPELVPVSDPAAKAKANAPIREAANEMAFEYRNAGFSYLRHTMFETVGVRGLSLKIPGGTLAAFIGETGSGKSTALQLANLVLFPEEGEVLAFGESSMDKKLNLRKRRMNAPLSVQMPERALFESFAGDEVAYGPRMQGYKGKELVARVRKAMDLVGLPYELYRDRNPRTLSGGQKRKLALASILAMDADSYLFDEPTASLDPCSAREVMDIILSLRKAGKTVVIATHDMRNARLADTVAVFRKGELAFAGKAEEACSDELLYAEPALECGS